MKIYSYIRSGGAKTFATSNTVLTAIKLSPTTMPPSKFRTSIILCVLLVCIVFT
jgi:hypothetical protein